MAATLFLFEYEYLVPILRSGSRPCWGTAVEPAIPMVLVIGLMSRLATPPRLVLTLVIQFVVGAANPTYANLEHFYWMALLLVIALREPRRISLDHLIERHLLRRLPTR